MTKRSAAKPKNEDGPVTPAAIPSGDRGEVMVAPPASKRQALQAEIARLELENQSVPEVIGYGARAGFVARQRENEEKLLRLKQDLMALNRNRAVYVRVSGSLPNETIAELEEEGPTVVVDASQPYEDLVDALLPVCNKTLTFDIPQYQRLVEVLSAWGRDKGVLSMPRPRFELRTCGTREGLVAHVRRAMEHETAFLGEYAATVLLEEIDEESSTKDFADFVAVVVINDDSGLVTANLVSRGGRGGKTIDVTDVAPNEVVETIFTGLEAAAA